MLAFKDFPGSPGFEKDYAPNERGSSSIPGGGSKTLHAVKYIYIYIYLYSRKDEI